jgi:pre-mRNA cleavage complex 2 protein Pcf11
MSFARLTRRTLLLTIIPLTQDWIKSREAVDTDYVPPSSSDATAGSHSADGTVGGGGGPSSGQKRAKLQYIPVPEDPRTNTVCPICQERFEMKWLDEAQEWVWMDAVKVGDRVFHATCHKEASRDRGSTPAGGSRGTPEPVLGKRKAEVRMSCWCGWAFGSSC